MAKMMRRNIKAGPCYCCNGLVVYGRAAEKRAWMREVEVDRGGDVGVEELFSRLPLWAVA